MMMSPTSSPAVQRAPLAPSHELILSNARIVTEQEVFSGSLLVRDGVIQAMEQGSSQLPQAIDCRGAYLIPGLVELHTDNLEKHFSPRPGVIWPARAAVLGHDAQLVSAGVTTVFDAIAVGDVIAGSTRLEHLSAMVAAIEAADAAGMLRAEHYLHLRCEVSHGGALEMFESLVDNPLLRLVSIMDHSPGQRQFVSLDKYREYYMGKHGFSREQMDEFIVNRQADSREFSDAYRREIARICQERGIALASHDDATLAHVLESAGYGMRIAEFPTTLEAARASHQHGLHVMMGAPNVVRGGSHSGNIAAAELAREGVLDILSSDYYPGSLLDAAFKLARADDNAYDLPRSVALVSANPASSAGLHDRGSIAPGKRADLLLVEERDGHPLIHSVWRAGERVF